MKPSLRISGPIVLRLLFVIVCLPAIALAAPSSLWNDFVAVKKAGREATLSDYSYAGYDYGESAIPDVDHKVFDVTHFGAVADDDVSDKDAIQAAIRAAEANGSGVVRFSAGRFLVSEDSDDKTPIRITGSHIVLRGAGCGEGGTHIHMKNHLVPKDKIDTRNAGTKAMFYAQLLENTPRDELLTKPAKPVRSGDFRLTVADASGLKAGDRIGLRIDDPTMTAAYLAPYKPDPTWTKIVKKGVRILERHLIVAVEGATLVFREPLRVDVDPARPWAVHRYTHLEGIGVEDIAFSGGWAEKFAHHKNAIHDGGWKGVGLERCVQSWVRRCRFTDFNTPVSMTQCMSSSILQATIDGLVGHCSARASGAGYGILIGLCDDKAGHHHGPGVAGPCVATVLWRNTSPAHSSPELHASCPRDTLFDCVESGWLYGRFGGAVSSLPNHLRGLTLWNFRQVGKPIDNYQFIRPGSVYGRVIMPIVVGYHGAATTFDESQIEAIESLGTPVDPESLYEAQLALRLGKKPAWIDAARKEWKEMK